MIKKFIRNNLVTLLMTLLLCVSYIRMVANFVLNMDIINIAIKYILIVFVILLIRLNFNKVRKPLFFVLSVILLISFHFALFVDNRPYISELFGDMWPYLISTFLCAIIISGRDLTLAFKVSSFIAFICGVALLTSADYFRYLTEYEYGGTGAVYSGLMLYPAISFLFFYRWEENKLYLLPSLISVICIVAFGGKRMAVVCYLLALLFVFFFKRKREELLKYIYITILAIGVISIFYADISTIVSRKFDFDLDSARIIDAFQGISALQDSGRADLRNELYSAILTFQGLLLGYGICGDYVITSSHQYSHNIFLEVIVEFGLILGVIIIAYMLYTYICAVSKRSDFRNHIILLTFVALIPLLQSGTFWNSTYFWLFLVLCYRSFWFKSLKLSGL